MITDRQIVLLDSVDSIGVSDLCLFPYYNDVGHIWFTGKNNTLTGCLRAFNPILDHLQG